MGAAAPAAFGVELIPAVGCPLPLLPLGPLTASGPFAPGGKGPPATPPLPPPLLTLTEPPGPTC